MNKADSSRINGARSHGPKTPEGLAISARNSFRHGITAKTLILHNESQDDFLEMFNSYFDQLQPANQIEIDLASDIVAARWRLRRIWRYQTAMLDVEMDFQAQEFERRYEEFDEDMRGSEAFTTLVDKSKGLSVALRYDIHLTRTYKRSVDEFRRQRKAQEKSTIPLELL